MSAEFGLFALLGMVSGLGLAVAAVKRWPLLGVLATSVVAITVWEVPAQPSLLSLGSTSLYYSDMVAAVLLAVGLINSRQLRRNVGSLTMILGAVFFLVGLSVMTGVGQFGLGPAFNEARPFLLLYSSLLWSLSLDWAGSAGQALLLRSSLSLGWALSIIGVYHAIRYGVGSSDSSVDLGGFDQTNRILISPQALLAGMCAIVAFDSWYRSRSRWLLISGAVFFVVVLVSQQRTVWAALAVAVILGFFVSRPRAKLAIVGAAIVALWFALVVLLSGRLSDLVAQIASSLTDEKTYGNRTTSWAQLVAQTIDGGQQTTLFGFPFGRGYERVEPNGLVEHYQPHNWYVSTFIRLGLLGLAIYLAMILYALLRLLRSRNVLALCVLVMVLVFCWAYGLDWYLHVYFGFALVMAYRKANNGAVTSEADRVESLIDARAPRFTRKPGVRDIVTVHVPPGGVE